MNEIKIALHPELARAATALARDSDITLGQLVRDLLARETSRRANARPPIRADEQLLAPLRARIAGDLAHAENWDDLEMRLKTKGFRLHAAGGGLALHEWPTGRRVCKASELGFSYSRLMRRFRAPFPGHPHTWLETRLLEALPDEEDGEVIEPF